jgi:hypothetical protein
MSRPAIRDTVLDIRAEVVTTTTTTTTEYTVIYLRCGKCLNAWEIRYPISAPIPGCPPSPSVPRTSGCKRCGRTCRIASAILPEVATW